jgi:hypothetical protein
MLITGDQDPACWSWPIWGKDKTAIFYSRFLEDADHYLLRHWHEDRCAICGEVEDQAGRHGHVLDHDHDSGLERGWLCRRCNTLEGVQRGSSAAPVILQYRERPPAVILGVSIVYVNVYGETPVTRPPVSYEELERVVERVFDNLYGGEESA